eukprot:TRINITY_DN3252_c1_g2_i1.p1 TRINITY_DN3252_c1_g2~~TRINITY_DN3252_c1_g2_i1.p1  ORF type:complete len:221 (-),score=14.50 TRINITY_DN3252_c1_g2_i1:1395-2057(-)
MMLKQILFITVLISADNAASEATTTTEVVQTIVQNPLDINSIASGLAYAVSEGNDTDISAIANAISVASTRGEAQALGGTFFDILAQQEDNSLPSSAAQSVAIAINTAVSEEGCEAISETLIEMEVLAHQFGQVENIDNIFSNLGPTRQCLQEDIIQVPVAAAIQAEFTRECTILSGVSCSSNDRERRFFFDSNSGSCFSSNQCNSQGFSTFRECTSNCP